MLRPPEELRDLVEFYLAELTFTPELGTLEEALRYPLESGGKRVRPVRIELVDPGPDDIALPMPDEREWKRALSRFRA